MSSDLASGGAFFAKTILVVGVVVGFGCGHTRAVGDPKTPSPAADEKSAPDGKTEKKVASGHAQAHADVPIKSDARSDAPPLATSPGGLLKPDAVSALQEKLVSRGHLSKDQQSGKFDEPTRGALRAFQRDNHFPATGMPDDLTVQKLGLAPDQVFRATAQPGHAGK